MSEREEILRSVQGQLGELGHLIDEIVQLARGDEQREGDLSRLRLDELATRCVDRVRLLAPHAEIAVDARPAEVDGVAAQLERAVGNLLDNAIKWSPEGARIDVKVRAGSLSVRDRGPGISPEDLPHVFDRFYRADTARALPGSGLGLAIVRQAAEAHGGSVTVASPPGGGTSLTLRFPPPSAPARPDGTSR